MIHRHSKLKVFIINKFVFMHVLSDSENEITVGKSAMGENNIVNV
jgi:hypothetical protein